MNEPEGIDPTAIAELLSQVWQEGYQAGLAAAKTRPKRRSTPKCANPSCGHALSMHNDLGYCRAKTTPDNRGNCMCACFIYPAFAAGGR